MTALLIVGLLGSEMTDYPWLPILIGGRESLRFVYICGSNRRSE